MSPRRDLTPAEKITWLNNEIEQASKMAAYFAKLRLRRLAGMQYDRASRAIVERDALKAQVEAAAKAEEGQPS